MVTKKVVTFSWKIGWHYQLPHRVTPILVTPSFHQKSYILSWPLAQSPLPDALWRIDKRRAGRRRGGWQPDLVLTATLKAMCAGASTQLRAVKTTHFMSPLPTIGGRDNLFSVRPLSVNIYFARRDISVLSGGNLMKPATRTRHVSGNCWKVCSRSEVKGQGRTCKEVRMLWRRRHTFRRCGVETHLLLLRECEKICIWILFLQITAEKL